MSVDRDRLRFPRPHRDPEVNQEHGHAPPSRLDVARLLLEVLQFAAEVYDRWVARNQSEEEAEMTPEEARAYAAEIVAAAEKAEAANRDGEDWGAP